MLQACTSAEEVEALSKNGQVLLQRLEDSKKPVVAAIMGSCLGGGLEVWKAMMMLQVEVIEQEIL